MSTDSNRERCSRVSCQVNMDSTGFSLLLNKISLNLNRNGEKAQCNYGVICLWQDPDWKCCCTTTFLCYSLWCLLQGTEKTKISVKIRPARSEEKLNVVRERGLMRPEGASTISKLSRELDTSRKTMERIVNNHPILKTFKGTLHQTLMTPDYKNGPQRAKNPFSCHGIKMPSDVIILWRNPLIPIPKMVSWSLRRWGLWTVMWCTSWRHDTLQTCKSSWLLRPPVKKVSPFLFAAWWDIEPGHIHGTPGEQRVDMGKGQLWGQWLTHHWTLRSCWGHTPHFLVLNEHAL